MKIIFPSVPWAVIVQTQSRAKHSHSTQKTALSAHAADQVIPRGATVIATVTLDEDVTLIGEDVDTHTAEFHDAVRMAVEAMLAQQDFAHRMADPAVDPMMLPPHMLPHWVARHFTLPGVASRVQVLLDSLDAAAWVKFRSVLARQYGLEMAQAVTGSATGVRVVNDPRYPNVPTDVASGVDHGEDPRYPRS